FLNMAVGLETGLDLPALTEILKSIENKQGRDRTQPRFSGRTLDIDILTYGDKTGRINGMVLPRPEITENAFVLWPLSQIAGSQQHPLAKKSMAQLWQEYDKDRQKLWPVDFNWHGRRISSREK
ncbi:MAG: 2-amino-4-hydroxy-6-hydroxymethyldihydropteridine diphosphokinase, partial [Pseudohongiellaceae bacterium]